VDTLYVENRLLKEIFLSYEKKKELLKKSEKLDEAINSVLKSDGDNLVFTPYHRNEIDKLQKQSKAILEKLRKDEFEIAVVGQEDSGKSSLLNALIKTDIFPSESGRTTYTSTKLVAGSGDKVKVEVTLYTYNEFDEIFINRLQAIGVDKKFAKEKGFKNFNPDLSPYKKSNNPTDTKDLIQDVEEILDNRDKIIELLENQGGKTLTFDADKINDFKVFVTGEEHNKSKPRATKEIIIYSSQLEAMPNSIIYDVPGFNSPTKLHKEQTEKMLKEADSIVFITDVSSPNLKGDELQTLSKGDDIFGVSLKEKLFVFGNKYDKANNESEAQKNEEKFKDDVLSQKAIGDEKRVFVGSAGKYLVDEKIGDVKIDNLPSWTKSNIDEFRAEIEKYYQFDRFEVLKKKVENTQKKTLEIFEEILNSDKLQNIDPDMDEDDLIEDIKDKTKAKIKEDTVKALNNIRGSLETKFLKETPFAKKLIDEVSNFFKPVTVEEIENFATDKREISLTNHTFRQKKFEELLKDFSAIVTKSVEHQTAEVEKEIFDSFVKAIQEDEKIRNIVKSEFDETYQSQEGKFDYLLERFGRRVLNSIIRYPIGDSDRKRAFEEHRYEFEFLDSRSELDNGTVINMIATGKNSPISSLNSLTAFKNEFWNALQTLVNSPKEYAEICKNSLFPKLEQLEQNQSSFDIDDLFKSSSISSIEEIADEINNDIENFKMILQKAVIPTLDLEIIFMGRVDAEIRKLRQKIENGKMDKAIRKAVRVVAKERLENVEKEIELNEAKLQIKTEIESFLNAN
jgi:GTPase Era involved in 16S rRNA processing